MWPRGFETLFLATFQSPGHSKCLQSAVLLVNFPAAAVFAVGALVLVKATSASAALSWILFLILVHSMHVLAVNSMGLCCMSVSENWALPVACFCSASLGKQL